MTAKVQPNEMTIWGMTLPTVIVAAVMGAAITLFGVFLQNLFENHRSNKRLKHDRDLRDREREMALRRDVYFETASEIAKAARYIAKFGDLNLSFAEHQAIAENFASALAKLHMIAGIEILAKAIKASDTFSTINLELRQLQLSLLLDQKQMGFMQKSVNDDIEQQKNILARISQLQIESPKHPDVPDLAKAFQELEARIQRSQQTHSELNEKMIAGQLSLSSTVFARTIDFAKNLIELSIALRKELDCDLKGDEEAYRQLVRESHEKATKEMQNYIDGIPKVMEEKRKTFQTGKARH